MGGNAQALLLRASAASGGDRNALVAMRRLRGADD
jgi:hypothetical protein